MPRTLLRPGLLLVLLGLVALPGVRCTRDHQEDVDAAGATVGSPELAVPTWPREQIWYQVLVERFRNGDPDNDPELADIEGAWPHLAPPDWAPTDWTHDWYEQEPWARRSGEGFYTTVHARRYGGDLAGLIAQLDRLFELGVTALYLNPIQDSPSLHKYDARNWRHVDRNFGPDPAGDRAIIESETPDDPRTWRITAADRLFQTLLDEAHRRGMRIVIDVSWNHTGATFWAWRDVLARGAASPYASWYTIERFDDPATPENEFAYQGWAGVRELPELRKVLEGAPRSPKGLPQEGSLDPGVKKQIFAVTRRWLDPDGDGDPSDGVDGFRLDVAELVPVGFWREYRRFVRSIRPDAYLVAELWWEDWPRKMLDPAPWLQGDIFDAVMNYRWFAPTRSFVAKAPAPGASTASYVAQLRAIEKEIPRASVEAMMNVVASHDTPRLATSLKNRGVYKFHANPRESPDYDVGPPDAETRARRRLVLVQQFTWRGAPHIFYGEELGMWGADDPDCRKPMLWKDIAGLAEMVLPDGSTQPPEPVRCDLELRALYQQLIVLRQKRVELFTQGEVIFPEPQDAEVLVYERVLGASRVAVLINPTSQPRDVRVEFDAETVVDLLGGERFPVTEGVCAVPVPALGARVLERR